MLEMSTTRRQGGASIIKTGLKADRKAKQQIEVCGV